MNRPLFRAGIRLFALALALAVALPWPASGAPAAVQIPQRTANPVLSKGEAADYRAFVQKNPGTWQYLPNESTGRIKDVYGAESRSYGSTPEKAARGFLAANEALVNAPSSDLRLASAKSGTISHFVFRQYHDGIPVEGAIVQVQVDRGGRVVWAETLADPIASDVATKAGISAAEAETSAATFAGLAQLPAEHPATTLVILPGDDGDRLAYKVRFSTDDPLGAWVYYVDAQNGHVIRTYDELLDGTAGTVHGKILPVDPNASVLTSKDMADEYVSVAGHRTTTKSTGSYSSSYSGTVRSDTTGPWAHIENFKTSELYRSASSASWTWSYTTGNTKFDELNAFYHINRIHDYFKGTFGVSQMDYQIKATVHYQQEVGTDFANAFYNPQTKALYFGDGDNVSARDSAKAAEVIYHEYGHATHDHVYSTVSDAGIYSMQIRSMGEAWADYFSQVLTGDDEFGEWWIINPAQHRALENTLRYPNDLQGEEHFDGPIYAGALWDYRQAVGAAIADKTVVASWDYHPTDFRSGLIAMIQADAELYDGAHEAQIRAAFTGHGITTALSETLGPLVFARNTAIAPYTAPYLYMAAADGSGARMITGTRSWEAPEWNETAGLIYACGKDQIGNTVIYAVDPLTELRVQPVGNLYPSGITVAQWPSSSPTGDRVCFSWGYQGQATMELAIAPLSAQPDPMAQMGVPVPNVDGMDAGANQWYPDWSKATDKIAYAQLSGPLIDKACAGLWVVNPDGSGLAQLTHPTYFWDANWRLWSEADYYPKWSRDGTRIAYVRVYTAGGLLPGDPLYVSDYHVYVMNANGSNAPGTLVLDGHVTFRATIGVWAGRGLGDLSWSPSDGALMFGVATGSSYLGSPTGYNLYRVNVNGTGLTQLTNDAGTATSCWGAPDTTPPDVSAIQVDPIYQLDRVSFAVDAADADSGVYNWQYAIGSSPGATDVRLWTTMGGAKTGATATHLGIVKDQTYYVSVKAKNAFGYVSTPVTSVGTVAEGPQTTALTITCNHSSAARGHTVSLSGTIAPDQPAGTHVSVYVKKPGTRTWRLLSTRDTFSSHHWSYNYKPTLRGTYYFQARFGGTGSYRPSTSGTKSLRVK